MDFKEKVFGGVHWTELAEERWSGRLLLTAK
jgi:hypothetical protein